MVHRKPNCDPFWGCISTRAWNPILLASFRYTVWMKTVLLTKSFTHQLILPYWAGKTLYIFHWDCHSVVKLLPTYHCQPSVEISFLIDYVEKCHQTFKFITAHNLSNAYRDHNKGLMHSKLDNNEYLGIFLYPKCIKITNDLHPVEVLQSSIFIHPGA